MYIISFKLTSYYKGEGVIKLGYLYVCNTSSDTISKIETNEMIEICKIKLGANSIDRIGPHGILVYKDKLLVVNNYSNSLSTVNTIINEEIEHQYIGANCNDISVFNNNAYIVCGESNSIIVFDLISKKIVEQIPCENLPHSISFDFRNKRMLVSNMYSDSITLIDCIDKEKVRNINVGAYPTKAIFSVDGEYIFVCESNIGGYERGNISIISSKNYRVLYRIQVGYSPVDIDCDNEYCYISNFGEGTISIVNIKNYEHIRKISIGGMPRGIKKIGDSLFVGDNYNNLLFKVDICTENKKAICIGGEPTGMALI